MADVMPSQLANAVLAKFYDILISGDDKVPPSEDNYFSWCTPGIPVDVADFDFLTQGLTGIVRKEQADIVTDASAGGAGGTPQPLPPAELERLRAQDTARLYMQAEAFARLVDFVPDVTKADNQQFARLAVLNNEGSLSEIYARVLRMSQVAHIELPEETKATIERLRGLLIKKVSTTDVISNQTVEREEPSDLVRAYETAAKLYRDAVLEYNAHRVDALTADNSRAIHYWAMNAKTLYENVAYALSEWETRGYKIDYEKIDAFISQVMSRDLALLKQEYRQDFERARLTGLVSGSDFQFATLVPGNFARSSGWTKFEFSSGDFQSRSSSSYQNKRWAVSGGGGFLGIFGGRANASGSTSHEEYHGTFSSDQFGLTFEITQVPIVRPWFKSSFLVSKTWRFDQNNPDVKSEMLNDGGAPPHGLLPAYPTSIVFVRNLTMTIGHSESFSNYVRDRESASQGGGGYLSFGPFFLGGSASNFSSGGSTSRDWGYKYDNNGISVPGMQIAGFKCHVLPKSPDPLSTITDWI